MKKTILIILFLGLMSPVIAQQFLWSATADTTIKWGGEHIPTNEVSSKILELYDHYDYHFDGTGYSKIEFIKSFENSPSFKSSNHNAWKTFKTKINDIKELTVFAFKSNSGRGSEVLVICVSGENVDLIGFSDQFEVGVKYNYSTEREKFARWLETLLK